MHAKFAALVSFVFAAQVLPTFASPLPEQANEERSLKAIGSLVIGGATSLAAGAAINAALGNRELPAELSERDVEERSLKAIGTLIVGGAASLGHDVLPRCGSTRGARADLLERVVDVDPVGDVRYRCIEVISGSVYGIPRCLPVARPAVATRTKGRSEEGAMRDRGMPGPLCRTKGGSNSQEREALGRSRSEAGFAGGRDGRAE